MLRVLACSRPLMVPVPCLPTLDPSLGCSQGCWGACQRPSSAAWFSCSWSPPSPTVARTCRHENQSHNLSRCDLQRKHKPRHGRTAFETAARKHQDNRLKQPIRHSRQHRCSQLRQPHQLRVRTNLNLTPAPW